MYLTTTLGISLTKVERPITPQKIGSNAPLLSDHAIAYSCGGYSLTPKQGNTGCAQLLPHGKTLDVL